MKRTLLLSVIPALALSLHVEAQQASPPSEPTEIQSKINKLRKQEILKTLGDAQTIVLCEFCLPEGNTVRKVLRGRTKVGELWNSAFTDSKTILIYERFQVGDLNGGAISATGYYPLEGLDKIVVSETNNCTLTIQEIEKYLRQHSVEQAHAAKAEKRGKQE